MEQKKDFIIVVGSYAIGMTIVCAAFPEAGETVGGKDFQIMHGGKGSNQAVAISRLGGRALFCGCIGADNFGDRCIALMEEENVDSRQIRRSVQGTATGVGFILVDESGQNEIVVDFAANNELGREDIDCLLPQIEKAALVLAQLEIPVSTVEYLAEKCRYAGVPFVLNPAPYKKIPDTLLANCDYLIPNQTEAGMLLGTGKIEKDNALDAAKKLQMKGVKNVIITLGKEGAILVNDNQYVTVNAPEVKVVDTTGAGDTFCGAFCVALTEGKCAKEALEFAVKAASLSVTKAGVIPSIPRRRDIS